MNKIGDINGLTEITPSGLSSKFYRLCKEGRGPNLVDIEGDWWATIPGEAHVDPATHKNIKVVIPLEYML